MPLRVSGKNIDIGEALRGRAVERASAALSRYFDDKWSGHLTVAKDGIGFRTECAIHIDSGMILHTEGTAGDAYSSVDLAITRLEKRLRRYKRRLRDSHHGSRRSAADEVMDAPYYVVQSPEADSEEEVSEEFAPVVVAESTTRFDELSVSEAVIRLDMTGAPVVVFRHAGNGRVNVVYRRPDGNVGWVDPPAALAQTG